MSQALELDICDLNLDQNNSRHCTLGLFGKNQLIVRRGQRFDLTLHVKPDSGKLSHDDNSFSLIAKTGPSPSKESGTLFTFPLHQFTDETQWSAVSAAGPTENTILVSITSPPDAPIGQYKLALHQPGNDELALGEFTLLFNPWCSKDTVYMPLEAERKEYILETDGMIYCGTAKRIAPRPWNFGQDESGILEICFKILDANPNFRANAHEDCLSRKDPVYVSRMLSAMINSNDDQGVLVGSWAREFPNGTPPWEWYGSGKILQQWSKSGPVRYGQCWVFAAVACTVCRVLGIPCRVVTNFNSAHDSNANLSIDHVFTMAGEEIETDDSIWNFHVWVECWMSRPDLSSEFAGWQVCDPTPQETSDGVFCCGPAPVRAIKEGELTKQYDAPFVFAEVNADVVTWLVLPNKRVKLEELSESVGRCISTKAVDSTERYDLTHEYKYPEGSLEERNVYEKAEHHNKLEQKGEEPGLYLQIKLSDAMVLGNDFEVFANVKNNYMDESKVVQCKVVFMAAAVGYNGKIGSYCAVSTEEMEVAPSEEKRLPLKLEYSRYASAITSERLIKLTVIGMDDRNSLYKMKTKTIVLDGPDIDIKLLGEARVNQPTTVELTMLNTLPEKIQDCSFIVQGSSLTGGEIEARIDPVGPREEAKARVEFKPITEGTRTLAVKFKSDKLCNVHSSRRIVVKKPLPSED